MVSHLILNYKKVLLRERKRHTARRIASARYGGGWGGYPIQSWWGVLYPVMGEGVPHTVMVGGGYPGYPHHPDLAGGYPIQ